jgi:hypothetical protein
MDGHRLRNVDRLVSLDSSPVHRCKLISARSLKNNFLGLDYANKTITFVDNGKGKFSCSTMENTTLAVNRALLNPDISKNKCLFISDFATSQSELVEMIENISDEKWTIKKTDSKAAIEENQKKVAEGDHFAVYKLIEIGFVSGRYGGWLEYKEDIMNEKLGLTKNVKEDVVRNALEKMKI